MNALIFVVFCFCSCLISLFSKKNDNVFLFVVSSLIFAFLIGNRSITDVPDTIVYHNFYKETIPLSLADFGNYGFEPGFQILTKLFKLFTFGYHELFFTLICLFNFYFTYKILNNFSENKNLYLVIGLNLYLVYFGLFYNAIVLRQGLALTFVVYAISLYYNKPENKKAYVTICLLFLLAFSMHVSSVVGIISFLIFKYSKSKGINHYIITLFLCVFTYFSKFGVAVLLLFFSLIDKFLQTLKGTVFEKYLFYQSQLTDITYEISFKILFFYVVAVIILLNFLELTKKDLRLVNVFFFGLFLVSFLGFVEQISRITDYFLIFSFVILYKIFIKIKNKDSRIIFLGLTLGLQLFFVFRIINRV